MKNIFNLYYLTINVTNKCNFKCIHCYNEEEDKRKLTTKEIKSLLNQASSLGTKYLLFTGGEPLLRKDIFTLLNYAKRKKFVIFLATNGFFINKDNVKKIKKYVTKVNVSLDGVGKLHDEIRKNKDAFKKAIQAICLLKSKKIRVSVSFTAHNKNVKEFQKLAHLCNQLGVSLTVKRFIPIGRGKKLRFSYKQYRDLCQKINKLKEKGYSIEFKDPLYAYKKINKDKFGGCLAGVHILSISADGEAYPCTKLKYGVGNIRKQKLSDIWWNSKILNRLRKRQLLGKCNKCDNKFRCGGCRAAAYAQFSNLFAEDPFAIYLCKKNLKQINLQFPI
jgi:radical SAM protein with 4Fe4S-binding SPASM domain